MEIHKEIKNMALFIDGDNISPKYLERIIAEVIQKGNIVIKRIYGDWTSSNMNGWKKLLKTYPIRTYQQFRKTQDNFIDGRRMQIIDGYYLSTCRKIITLNQNDHVYLAWLRSNDQTKLQVIQITKD